MRALLLALQAAALAQGFDLPKPPPASEKSIPVFAPQASAPAPKVQPLPACRGGNLIIASFPLSSGSPYTMVVLNDGFETIQAALAGLKSKGLTVAALVNGGYFDPSGSAVLSYFKSSAFGKELPENSARSPRACMVYHPGAGEFELLQSTPENYEKFRAEKAEIYCAGPQLVEKGANVAVRQNCREQFSPQCREDRSDPGVNVLIHYPRTGSCFTKAGTFKIFSANSNAAKCGLSGPLLAQAMIAEGCVEGMNHDGGGSAQLYIAQDFGAPVWALGAEPGRTIPVWIAVVKKR